MNKVPVCLLQLLEELKLCHAELRRNVVVVAAVVLLLVVVGDQAVPGCVLLH